MWSSIATEISLENSVAAENEVCAECYGARAWNQINKSREQRGGRTGAGIDVEERRRQ